MSDATTQVTVEEVKPVVPEVAASVETATAAAVSSVVPDALKADVEKIVKDVLKLAIKELLDDLKKSPLGKLDKDGDGVISATEVKEAVKEQAQKLGCAPSCTIS
jgi:predicted dinucleotide-utilizing enzyme